MEENLESIIERINSLIPELEKETNQLIEFIKNNKKNYTNKKTIEQINRYVEYELDFLMNPFTEKQFYKTLSHWEKLNPESANDYKKLYKNIYKK